MYRVIFNVGAEAFSLKDMRGTHIEFHNMDHAVNAAKAAAALYDTICDFEYRVTVEYDDDEA